MPDAPACKKVTIIFSSTYAQWNTLIDMSPKRGNIIRQTGPKIGSQSNRHDLQLVSAPVSCGDTVPRYVPEARELESSSPNAKILAEEPILSRDKEGYSEYSPSVVPPRYVPWASETRTQPTTTILYATQILTLAPPKSSLLPHPPIRLPGDRQHHQVSTSPREDDSIL